MGMAVGYIFYHIPFYFFCTMFSGIVEEGAIVTALHKDNDNLNITLKCSFTNELKIDQSVSHNGVCLTVVDIKGEEYTVTAIKETLERSNLGLLKIGSLVNVERSMLMNGRLDGHIVQGHVDQTAVHFEYKTSDEMRKRGYITVDKGSVTVNGVSLTVCTPTDNSFEVAIIPYTFNNTNFCQIQVGTIVNLEFDIIGKYIARIIPA